LPSLLPLVRSHSILTECDLLTRLESWHVDDSGRDTPEVVSTAVSPAKPSQTLDSTLHMLTNIPHVRSLLNDIPLGDDVQSARYQTDRLLALLRRAIEREVELSKTLWETRSGPDAQ